MSLSQVYRLSYVKLIAVVVLACGLWVNNYVTWLGFVSIAILVLIGEWHSRCGGYWYKTSGILLAIWSLDMAVHNVPGFNNILVWQHIKLSEHAIPFTMYINFDKGIVGVVLALYCISRKDVMAWRETILTSLRVFLLMLVCVISIGFFLDVFAIDYKQGINVWWFASVNLMFVCIAEEAFFRLVIQDRLLVWCNIQPRWCMVLSGVVFGLVHLRIGMAYSLLAMFIGIGCAWVYHRSKRLEMAIMMHWLVNVLHFSLLTYPMKMH